MDRLFDCLVRWLAPVLCFTAEEAWLARHGDTPGRSIHLELFADVPGAWRDAALGGALGRIARLRRVVTGALEAGARRKAASVPACRPRSSCLCRRGSCRCCATSISPNCASPRREPCGRDAAGRLPSHCPMLPGVGVVVAPAAGTRCERCWRVLPEVGQVPVTTICAGAAPMSSTAAPCRSNGGRRVMIARPVMLGARARRGGRRRGARPAQQSCGARIFSARPAARRITAR